MRVLDQLTIERIEQLQQEAEQTGKTVDWETGTLIPRPYQGMDHHQRDALAARDSRKQFYRDLDDSKDNDPASPEEAGW